MSVSVIFRLIDFVLLGTLTINGYVLDCFECYVVQFWVLKTYLNSTLLRSCWRTLTDQKRILDRKNLEQNWHLLFSTREIGSCFFPKCWRNYGRTIDRLKLSGNGSISERAASKHKCHEIDCQLLFILHFLSVFFIKVQIWRQLLLFLDNFTFIIQVQTLPFSSISHRCSFFADTWNT